MAKRGRPPKQSADPVSKHIRVKPELEQLIRLICKAEHKTTAELVDPILRPAIMAKFKMRYSLIVQLKAAEDESLQSKGLPPTPALPPFTTADPITGDEVSAEQAAKSAEAIKRGKPRK